MAKVELEQGAGEGSCGAPSTGGPTAPGAEAALTDGVPGVSAGVFASDDEAGVALDRMVVRHRPALERLAR